jgi:hypothetical protein
MGMSASEKAVWYWCHLVWQKQSIRHSKRSEESLRVPLVQNKEGFLASLGMTNQKGLIAKRREPKNTTTSGLEA